MKKQFSLTLTFFLLFSVIVTSSSWAGQVVTNDIKLWAKQAIEQEKALVSRTAPSNSVAVLYFNNKSKKSDLKLLEKGLTLMIVTDLHKVKDIRLVERVKLQALMNELDLTASKLTDKKASARMGKLLGAANLVGGDILDKKLKNFQVESNLIDVQRGNIFGRPEVEGKLLDDLFKMEKELVFEIIKMLKIQLTPEEELELKKPLTTSLRALMYFIQAIEYSDAEDYAKAQEYYEKALLEDPGFDLAQLGLLELKELHLYIVRVETYTEPEGDDVIEESDDPRKSLREFERSEIEEFERSETDDLVDQTGSIEVGWDFDFDMYLHIEDNLKSDMVVDFDGISNEIKLAAEDDALMETIADGTYVGGNFDATKTWTSSGLYMPSTYSFWSGNYEFGFQTVGQSNVIYDADGNISYSTPMYFQPGILGYDERTGASLGDRTSLATPTGEDLSDGFLAYAVQLEEDRMNKKIIDMFDDNFTVNELVQDALEKNTIRARDALFTQIADAQAGRVLRDNENNWTRVQQYIIRYTQSGQTTVQMLNASLRKGSSTLAGFSTINWTTVLNTEYIGDLRDLPWSSWLSTEQGGYYYPYIITDPTLYTQQGNEPDIYPLSMSVAFKNPQNDVFKQLRTISAELYTMQYSSGFRYIQHIESESVEVNGILYSYGIERADNTLQYYLSDPYQNSARIDIEFSIIEDMTIAGVLPDVPEFTDIWDALRVNEFGAKTIGDNCLGINISDPNNTILSSAIDVIYIPMSRMLWKTYID